jgi:hypothetical protein
MNPTNAVAAARRLSSTPLPLPPRLLVTIAAGWALPASQDAVPPLPPGERAYEKLVRCDDYDVWLIHWSRGSGLEPHDHGESAGAFYVVRGELVEVHHERRGERRAPLPVGARGSRTFRVGDVHEVRNDGVATASSVHVYSPPLADMRFPAPPLRRHLRLVSSGD